MASVSEILDTVSRMTRPEAMSTREALEFIEELIGELEMTADALRHDLNRE